jgi:hypothetical protein
MTLCLLLWLYGVEQDMKESEYEILFEMYVEWSILDCFKVSSVHFLFRMNTATVCSQRQVIPG